MHNFRIVKFGLSPSGQILPLANDDGFGQRYLKQFINSDDGQPHDVVYWYWSPLRSYIGQTSNLRRRNAQHYKNDGFSRKKYTTLFVIYGSAITDATLNAVESLLIQLFDEDARNRPDSPKPRVDNLTQGNLSSYMNRVRRDLIPDIWDRMRQFGCDEGDEHRYVYGDASAIRSSLLYKYSVFNNLSHEQAAIVEQVVGSDDDFVIQGLAGTGKTALLTNLAVALADRLNPEGADSEYLTRDRMVAVVVKGNWVKNATDIFKRYGNKAITVKRPDTLWHERRGGKYGAVIVDEAQRLTRRYSKTKLFKAWTRDPDCRYDDELEIVKSNARKLVLLYDPFQSIRPDDIKADQFAYLTDGFARCMLTEQFRVNPQGSDRQYSGSDYTNGIIHALELDLGHESDYPFRQGLFDPTRHEPYESYFGVSDSIADLFAYIDEMRNQRPGTVDHVIAGYVRQWVSKKDRTQYDWQETYKGKEYHWQWNENANGWVRPTRRSWEAQNEAFARHNNEIGSVHAIQGEDFNYVGAIIGKDLEVGADGHLHGNKEAYFDQNGIPAASDFHDEEFTDYIKHVYFTILMRAVDGIRVYFEDPTLRKFFMERLTGTSTSSAD